VAVTHTYTAPGEYKVKLKVIDSEDNYSEIEKVVTVLPQTDPIAKMRREIRKFPIDLEVGFDGADSVPVPVDGPEVPIVSWEWDFGDGETGSETQETGLNRVPMSYPVGPTGPSGDTGPTGYTGYTGPSGEGGGGEAFPVGSVFIAVVDTNPSTLLGYGTWSKFGAGRFLVGIDSGDADFDEAEETGGEKTHTLTEDEMPAHTHTQHSLSSTSGSATHCNRDTSSGGDVETADETSSSGSGNPHNNLPPYIAVYMWKRTE
jgi:hypothetical protein